MKNARVLVSLACLCVVACAGAAPPAGSTTTIATTASAPVPSASTTATTTSGAAKTTTTIKRIIVSLSRPSGTMITTTAPDGTTTMTLDVLENGRGPHVDATWTLGSDGTIASFSAKGHHTMGTKVDETFARDGKHVKWKSAEESGERDVDGSAFFVPIADAPEILGVLARALIAAKNPLPLLPGGSATIEKTIETTIDVGGQKKKLVGYSIVGLDLVPTHVWMNEDGSWFGLTYPWFAVVPEGYASVIDGLVALQTDLDRKRDVQIAKTLATHPPAAGIAYTHARVLDVEHGRWLADHTVVVVGEKIVAVGPTKTTKIPVGTTPTDLAGKAILPGLWDMHAHLGDADGALDVASGVTTARDVGNDPDKLDDYKKRFDSGEAIGPHVIRFGFIEGRGEKAASSKITAEDETEAKAAVEFFAKRGYEGIKIYNSVKPELVPLLAKEAHARKMMVTGHVPVHMLANEAVKAGYDGIEHVNMLFLNFFATHDTDTRDTTRFTLVGDKAATFDLKSKPALDFFALLQSHHTIIDPTIGAFEDLLVGEQGKIVPGLEPLVERLPVQTSRGFLLGGLPLDGGKAETYRKSFEKLLEMVKTIAEKKIPLVVGTDTLAGLMLHHELALYVRAGIEPADVLRMASLDAAKSMKMEAKTGSISPGKTADLFIVDGDPLARIDDVRNVLSTMIAGVVVPSKELYATVGVKP